MLEHDSPAAVVQRQLDAYNARDVDALLATYAPDARQYEYPATLLASGHDEFRPRFAARFQEPDLHARLLQRVVMGKLVMDHEVVTRNFPEGKGSLELVAIYEVVDGRIRSQSVQLGAKRLDAPAA
ncbi:SnoaL-like domain-containing protein [Massilia forsythiae]|uniref:SnoaL-like domain-containing protein n=1 Tax=Massilia forsythiae TaxID=2728020 RepID=A0A7Z2VUT3_9BURK|nr:nuclear transport factor 2 family protein [Massilia forsythiae]QJD99522.1 SnoaL-like domain-containing protein [Massilia forsythiae]